MGSKAEQSEIAHLLVELGVTLGRCNYATPHSEELIHKVAQAHSSEAEVVVLPTVVMAEDMGLGHVAIKRIGSAYRFDQIAAVQHEVVPALAGSVDPHSAVKRLRQIKTLPTPIPAWLRVVGYALAATGYAMVLRLSPQAIVLAVVLGALVGITLLLTARSAQISALMPVLATFACALVVSVGYVQLGEPIPVKLAAVPVLVLLPGAAMTAAVIELVSGHMISGASRLVYALMILLAMAFAFSFAMQLSGASGGQLADLTRYSSYAWLPWLGVVLFAIGIMIYFCMPVQFWIPTTLITLLAYAIQFLGSSVVSPAMAAGVATAVCLTASWTYNHSKGSGPLAMAMYLPAFWLLVPGSGGFIALTGVIDRNDALAGMGLQTGVTVLSMAIGVMVASLASPAINRLR